ncbi:nucleotidyltransferase substrate binding protein, partial [Thermovibrio sp.]
IAVEVLSKRFEYTYEDMWKAVKEALRERGIECNSPRSCFRELLKEGIAPFSYKRISYKMVELRNTPVYIYSQEQAEEIYGKIREFLFKEAFEATLKGLKNLE